MSVSASQLRQDVYRLLDEVLESGVPLEIERRGQRLRIVAVRSGSKLERINGDPNAIVGDPQDLVDIDWAHAWDPDE